MKGDRIQIPAQEGVIHMNKFKKTVSLILIVIMLASLAACGAKSTPTAEAQAAPVPTGATEAAEATSGTISAEVTPDPDAEVIDAQLELLFEEMSVWNQDAKDEVWEYTVTDLDHNGRLELIAALNDPDERTTKVKIWEIGKNGKALDECVVQDTEGFFPDIVTENTDTVYTAKSDEWAYFFYDNTLIDGGAKTIKCSVRLKNGELGVTEYAYETALTDDEGKTKVSHTDLNGVEISAEAYNDAGIKGFTGAMRGSTNLDWFAAGEAEDITRLTGSYRVFTGEKLPPDPYVAPVPTPAPSEEAQPSATPAATAAPTPVPTPEPVYLTITKNPTSEYRKEGETGYFIAGANNFSSASWMMVSPYGGEYTPQNFAWIFPNCRVSGEYSTSLTISNLSSDMSGWGAYCTFYYNEQTARTSTAYLNVEVVPVPTPAPSGRADGTVSGYSYSTVTINLYEGGSVNVTRNICNEDGSIYIGAPCECYFNVYNGVRDYYYVYIMGKQMVGPIYGSMSGTISSHGNGYITILMQDGSYVTVSTDLVNVVTGVIKDGCSCTVYYQNYLRADYIYSVDVYGANEGTGFGFGY